MDQPVAIAKWERLSAAIAHALSIHASQMRKGTDTPYISHLLGVVGLVLEHGGDEDSAIAGVLHDAIEDVGAEQETIIRARFGHRVADVVRACTDADTFPKPPWQARKDAYVAHLHDAGRDTLTVSACDKLHNARAIIMDLRTQGLALFERFAGGRDGTLWYYSAVSEVVSDRLPGPLAVELAEAVATMNALSPR